MPYKNRIDTIRQSILLLENKIAKPNDYDSDAIFDMRRQIVTLTTELNKLQKRQWEEDHDRVNFEDDR